MPLESWAKSTRKAMTILKQKTDRIGCASALTKRDVLVSVPARDDKTAQKGPFCIRRVEDLARVPGLPSPDLCFLMLEFFADSR